MTTTPLKTRHDPLAVIAIGGHALLPPEDLGTHREQSRRAVRIAKDVVRLIREGFRVLVVHGNGPQVGRELQRMEEASTKLPERPLDVCVATTQGSIGHRLSVALRNTLQQAELTHPVSTVLTHVLVNPNDGGFERPTKPIGPFYTAWRAKELTRTRGWQMVEDAGRGWRQVVPSPKPVDILDLPAIETLLNLGHVVIAAGGGGTPVVVEDHGRLVGIEAVIDKDQTAALLGTQLEAELLVLLTGVDHAYIHYGRPEQEALATISVPDLREHLRQGHFAIGSMRPKIEAAVTFVEDGGARAIITSADRLLAGIHDRAGTRVTADGGGAGARPQLDLFNSDSEDDVDPVEGEEDIPSVA